MSKFHNRVIETINAVIRRSATYPNALYLGRAEQQQLRDERQGAGSELLIESDEYVGLKVFCVDAPSHFAAVWNPSLDREEEPPEWRLDYIEVPPIRTSGPGKI